MSRNLGMQSSKVNKFTEWTSEEKLKVNGTNVFKVIRKLKKQLKAEAYSGMANSINKYPAVPFQVEYPKENSYLPENIAGEIPFKLTPALEEKLRTKALEDFVDEKKAYVVQNAKLYEHLAQQVIGPESMEVIKSDPDWKKLDGKTVQDDWCGLYNLMIKTHVIVVIYGAYDRLH